MMTYVAITILLTMQGELVQSERVIPMKDVEECRRWAYQQAFMPTPSGYAHAVYVCEPIGDSA